MHIRKDKYAFSKMDSNFRWGHYLKCCPVDDLENRLMSVGLVWRGFIWCKQMFRTIVVVMASNMGKKIKKIPAVARTLYIVIQSARIGGGKCFSYIKRASMLILFPLPIVTYKRLCFVLGSLSLDSTNK